MVLVDSSAEKGFINSQTTEDNFQSYNNITHYDQCTNQVTKTPNKTEVKTISSTIINSTSKEYDPYDYCTVEKPTTYCDSLLHLIKVGFGSGILATPSSYKDVGYVFGPIGIILMTILYTTCIHLLISSEYELCKRKRIPNMSYANTVHAAFAGGPNSFRCLANSGKFFTNFFFIVFESGSCAIYIIFISSNIKQLLDFYLGTDQDLRTFMLYMIIPMVTLCWIRNLKFLAPLSAASIIIAIISFSVIFWYVFREPLTFEGKHAFGSISKVPLYCTTILFAISSTGAILPLKAEMRKPKQLGSCTGVLNVSMATISILYPTFGFVGYLKYGDQIKGSITLNLPEDELLAQSIKGFYSLSIFICYFICFYVVRDVLWTNYLEHKIKKNIAMWEFIIRTMIPIITFMLAYSIPNLETFISLVGALGISTTSLILPIIVHSLVFWNHMKSRISFFFFFLRNTFLLTIALTIFVTGVYDSTYNVIRLHREEIHE